MIPKKPKSTDRHQSLPNNMFTWVGYDLGLLMTVGFIVGFGCWGTQQYPSDQRSTHMYKPFSSLYFPQSLCTWPLFSQPSWPQASIRPTACARTHMYKPFCWVSTFLNPYASDLSPLSSASHLSHLSPNLHLLDFDSPFFFLVFKIERKISNIWFEEDSVMAVALATLVFE